MGLSRILPAAALSLLCCARRPPSPPPPRVVPELRVGAALPPVAPPPDAAVLDEDAVQIPGPQTCATLLAWSRARVARRCKSEDYVSDRLPDLPQCVPAPDGAWALLASECVAAPSAQEGAGLSPVTVLLVHLDAQGRASTASAFTTGDDTSTTFTPPLLVGDLEHDGRSEVLFRMQNMQPSGRGESGSWGAPGGFVMTATPTGIVRYAAVEALSGLTPSGLRDLDGDGRTDLLVRELPYEIINFPEELVLLELAAHSLPDGTLSLNDAVALDFDRRACGARFASLSAMPLTPVGLACARLWGYPEAAVLAQVRRRYRDANPVSSNSLTQVARTAPRVHL